MYMCNYYVLKLKYIYVEYRENMTVECIAVLLGVYNSLNRITVRGVYNIITVECMT